MSSNVEEQDAEPLELLSEAQKAARDADLDARLEKLKLEVNQEPIHIPHPETVKATEDLLERLAALRQEHAAATATADAFRKSIAKLPEKCSIEELKAKFKEGAAEAPETLSPRLESAPTGAPAFGAAASPAPPSLTSIVPPPPEPPPSAEAPRGEGSEDRRGVGASPRGVSPTSS